MDIGEKLLGGFRDKKLIQLYTALSKSDFKGNYEDTYTIELMFALMCLDLSANVKKGVEINPSDLCLLARNVVRLADDGELSDISFMNWSDALLTYMLNENLNPNQINKMNQNNLMKNVKKYTRGWE